MQALVSIHDVMPQHLPEVQALLARLAHLQKQHIVLLIVPGCDWQAGQLDLLRNLQQQGYVLAGHGWLHRTRRISGMYHKMHAALVSRTAAEHLSLSEAEILQIIGDCHAWFGTHDLAMPDLYVPPAWAMGRICRDTLRGTPFRFFETTAGFHDVASGRSITLPLAGFEADNRFRQASLRCWNSLNEWMATTRRPLRIAIHPRDGQLLLRESLDRTLRRLTGSVDYHALF